VTSQGPDHTTPASTPRRPSWSDLGPRVGSAAVLITITVVAMVLGSYAFGALVGAAFGGAYREWETMVLRRSLAWDSYVLVGLVALTALAFPFAGYLGSMLVTAVAAVFVLAVCRQERWWRLAGVVFFSLVVIAAMAIRGSDTGGVQLAVFVATVIWSTDTAAFFTGRQVGGEKLAPQISPSKTWSGALGGLALGVVGGTIVWSFISAEPWWWGALLSLLLSVLGQLGDLTESAIKRNFRIKDSGDIIPGHGGLMDRLDSLTLGVLFVCAVGLLHGGHGDVAAGFLNW